MPGQLVLHAYSQPPSRVYPALFPTAPAANDSLQSWLDHAQCHILLNASQRAHHQQWQRQLAAQHVQWHFGRATWCQQLPTHSDQPQRWIAMTDDRAYWLVMDWQPAATGLDFTYHALDGTPQGGNNLQHFFSQAVASCPAPSILSLPTNGPEQQCPQIMPYTSLLADWVMAQWMFPESQYPLLNVVGSLYRLYDIQQRYAHGEIAGQAVLLEIEDSPLAGLVSVRWVR